MGIETHPSKLKGHSLTTRPGKRLLQSLVLELPGVIPKTSLPVASNLSPWKIDLLSYHLFNGYK
jgi:hypothetical protein